MSRLKLVVFSSIPALIVSLFLVGVSEVGLRTYYRRVEVITGAVPWHLAEWNGLFYYWDSYHSLYGWTNSPGYVSDSRVPFKVSINNQGLRALYDYEPSPPRGKKRFLLFGDSFAFGEEVGDDQTVPVHLEAQLDQVEVLNFGVHGYGLGQMMLRLEEEGFAFNPDHVLFMFLTLDYERDSMEHFVHNMLVFRAHGASLRIDNVPVPEASRQPWLYRHCFTAAWLWGQPVETPRRSETIMEAMQLPILIFERLRIACAKRKVPLTLVFLTCEPQIRVLHQEFERYQIKAMRWVLEQSGIETIDLVDFLQRKHKEIGPRIETSGGHWSGEGNLLIAKELSRRLDLTR